MKKFKDQNMITTRLINAIVRHGIPTSEGGSIIRWDVLTRLTCVKGYKEDVCQREAKILLQKAKKYVEEKQNDTEIDSKKLKLMYKSTNTFSELYKFPFDEIYAKNIECFFVPAGTAVELYATTLHYAPCKENNEEFRCGVVLPKGTNLPLQVKPAENKGENQLLFAANKWLIGHSESGVDKDGGFIGLIGENTTI